MVLKVPLHLPYYNSSGTTERVDGEIEIDGTHYNYVKRQVSNDTLYLYCIPNTAKTKLRNAQADFSKQACDTQSDTGKGGNALLKKMKWSGEYNFSFLNVAFTTSEKATSPETGFLLPALMAPPSTSPYQPPEQA
jgi:hypothetical protein